MTHVCAKCAPKMAQLQDEVTHLREQLDWALLHIGAFTEVRGAPANGLTTKSGSGPVHPRRPKKNGRSAMYIDDYLSGLRVRDIAEKHGVSAAAVSKVLGVYGYRGALVPQADRWIDCGSYYSLDVRGSVVLVDKDDLHIALRGSVVVAKDYTSSVSVRTSDGQRFILAREIMSCPADMEVDHKDGNPLDNRRANLRICARMRNAQNKRKYRNGSSQYKGVTFAQGRYQAKITANKNLHYLGSFIDEVEAARAYDAAARFHHGEFACVNFPREGERGALINRSEMGVIP